MEEFYKLLTNYNNRLLNIEQRPDWHLIYCKSTMPIYLRVLLKRLENLDKNLSIIEVGSGYGDVVAMLIHLGFRNVTGIERDQSACIAANKKIKELFKTKKQYIRCEDYPVKLNYSPDIYIQINNVYSDSILTKDEYMLRNKEWIQYNGKPAYTFIEFIDASFTQDLNHYPALVRLSNEDVEKMFYDYEITAFKTYEYPKNTSSKCLYEIRAKLIN